MTATRFDVPTSESPARRYARPSYAHCDGIAFRIVRLIWLTARLTRQEPVTLAHYQRRFGVSLRSFRRDIALLREAGFYLDTATPGNYRMLCFLSDADHA